MGIMCHHAIVVTTRDEYAAIAHKEAVRCCGKDYVTPLGAKVVNGVQSFLVTPDGSKEGWPESAQGEQTRATFLAWLDRQRWGDGSTPYEWVLIEYGERPAREGAAILKHAWHVNVGDRYKGPHDLDSKRDA